MTIAVAFDGTPAPAQGGSYEPLPDNTKVLATILPTRRDGTSIEQVPYSAQGDNASLKALNVRFRIADGQAGAGRNVFARVPLARRFASGKVAYLFFGFFRSLGYDVDSTEGIKISSDRELLGREVELVLGISDQPDKNGNYSNTVKFINEAKGIPAQAGSVTLKPRVAETWTPSSSESKAAASPWTPDPDPDPELQAAADSAVGF